MHDLPRHDNSAEKTAEARPSHGKERWRPSYLGVSDCRDTSAFVVASEAGADEGATGWLPTAGGAGSCLAPDTVAVSAWDAGSGEGAAGWLACACGCWV